MSLATLTELNWLAVLVGGLAYFAVGAIWYSPALFSRQWAEASGTSMDQPGNVAAYLAANLVIDVIVAAALALVVVESGAETFGEAFQLGLVAAVGLALPALVVTQLYERRPAILHAINGGYHLLGLMIAAVIVTVWQ